MSAFNDLDITCEKCGEEFRGTVWTAVHAGQDPELRDLLKGGELNLVMCPGCSHVAFHEHFLIYQDSARELVAYVYPEHQSSDRDMLERLMHAGFKEAQEGLEPRHRVAYDPQIFFGLESLVELLHAEDERIDQSDVAEAVCKERKIPFLRLAPYAARGRGGLEVLPSDLTKAGATRTSVLSGLDRLLEADPALDLYRALRDRIAADPGWTI